MSSFYHKKSIRKASQILGHFINITELQITPTCHAYLVKQPNMTSKQWSRGVKNYIFRYHKHFLINLLNIAISTVLNSSRVCFLKNTPTGREAFTSDMSKVFFFFFFFINIEKSSSIFMSRKNTKQISQPCWIYLNMQSQNSNSSSPILQKKTCPPMVWFTSLHLLLNKIKFSDIYKHLITNNF